MDLFEKMMEPGFSETERGILDYVLQNAEQIEGLSISELAARTHSSNTSILRLCRKLGLEGYREFRNRIIRELEIRKNGYRPVDYTIPFSAQSSIPQIIEIMKDLTRNTADLVAQSLNWKVLYEAGRLIRTSQRVFTVATGDSMIRASSFQHKLLKLGIFLLPINTDGDPGAYVAHSTDQDCALFITYSGEGLDYAHYAREFRKHGTAIITVTANPSSAPALYANCLIPFEYREEKADAIGAFYSQIALEFILSTLYSVIYSSQYRTSREKKLQAEAVSLIPDPEGQSHRH